MWTETAMWLCGVLSFIGGFIFACILMSSSSNSEDATIEKRGVWTIKDRSYKLSLIMKDPR